MIETISLFGSRISLYYVFWLIGAIVVLLIGCRLGKHFGFSYSKSITYISGAIALGYLLLWGTSWIFGGGKMNGLNFVRIVIFMPIPVLILTQFFRDSFWHVADLVAPLLALFHGITHIGCVFPGCCHGYASSWGLYSNIAGTICFPIQLVEAGSSILIGVGLAVMIRGRVQQGKQYAWYLLLFGATRFTWEFFRDNEKLWNGISELAVHALAAMYIGILGLMILKNNDKRKRSYEEDKT